MWSHDELALIVVRALRDESARFDAEQLARGLDSLDERALHPVLAAGFLGSGLGVFAEHPYPPPLARAARRPKASERERCDLLLTPSPGRPPIDPLAIDVLEAASRGTLFESAARARIDAEPGCPPDECFWLEVKAVGQHAYQAGVPMPNRAYASELTGGATRDIAKLGACPDIRFGASLLVLFAQDEGVARHDLGVLSSRCVERGLPIRPPVSDGFPIPDRIGNAWCAVWLAPLRPVR